MDRRRFLKKALRMTHGGLFGAVGLACVSRFPSQFTHARPAPPGQHPLRPPGALDEPNFRKACIRCWVCGEVCSVSAIQFPGRITSAQPPLSLKLESTHRDDNTTPVWRSPDTPYILPWLTACDLCMRCGQVCPTGAIRPIKEEPEAISDQVKMGVARIDRKVCLPWTRTSWCGACLTICPYRERAITVDHQNRPSIHREFCVGCGLCVEVCPMRTKAIAVLPNFVPDEGRVREE